MADLSVSTAAPMPGANFGGTNAPVPSPGGGSVPAIGSVQTNAFAPAVPTGQATAPPSAVFPANSGGVNTNLTPGAMPNFSGGGGTFAQGLGFGQGPGGFPSEHDFIKAMRKAGFSAGDAGLLFQFLQSGAGFNPQILQAIFSAMNPQIMRGEQDLLEQFSGQGLRFGSPAAIGMGDYLSQVALDEGQIAAQMAEQATQNYMSVLLAGKGPAPQSLFSEIMQGITALGTLGAGVGGAETGAAKLGGH